MRLAWACAGGNMHLLIDSASTEALHKSLKNNEPDDSDVLGSEEMLKESFREFVSVNHNVLKK